MEAYDVVIIGGGAGGLFAANLLAQKGVCVCVAELSARVGKKLSTTGGGRCNLSNNGVTAGVYGNAAFAEYAVGAFGTRRIREIFRDMGLVTKVEDDRIYPYSESAATVTDVLRGVFDGVGRAVLKTNCRVIKVEKHALKEQKDINKCENGKNRQSERQNFRTAGNIGGSMAESNLSADKPAAFARYVQPQNGGGGAVGNDPSPDNNPRFSFAQNGVRGAVDDNHSSAFARYAQSQNGGGGASENDPSPDNNPRFSFAQSGGGGAVEKNSRKLDVYAASGSLPVIFVEAAKDTAFVLTVSDNGGTYKIAAKKVVLASGSPAGGGADSLRLYTDLGHSARPFVPALAPLTAERGAIKGLSGLRVFAEAEFAGAAEQGEIQFRDFGVSGIAVFNLAAKAARRGITRGVLKLDFLPEYDVETAKSLISTLPYGLYGILRRPLADAVLRYASELGAETALNSKTGKNSALVKPFTEYGATVDAVSEKTATVVRALKNFEINVSGLSDMSLAQTAAGGLNVSEFNDKTMESRVCPGLYAIGECLDVDGPCGGFNLHWAFASAAAAAGAIAERMEK
jgi:predicted Rossmann fold flavoprotein